MSSVGAQAIVSVPANWDTLLRTHEPNGILL